MRSRFQPPGRASDLNWSTRLVPPSMRRALPFPSIFPAGVSCSGSARSTILPGFPHGKQSGYTRVGGIWQSVCLETRPRTCFTKATFFLPDIDASLARAQFSMEEAGQVEIAHWQI